MYRFRHLIILPALLSAGLMSLHAVAAEPPILTISGAIEQVNRGPSHEDDATILGAHDISFQKGFSVTREGAVRHFRTRLRTARDVGFRPRRAAATLRERRCG
jgi:hypothetical protein